jgi:hypothetical protein
LILGLALLAAAPAALNAAPKPEAVERDRRIDDYLSASFAAEMTQVQLTGSDTLRISGRLPATNPQATLLELPIWSDATDPRQAVVAAEVKADANGLFSIDLPRQVALDSRPHDRLCSRWAVARKAGQTWQLLSAPRWVDDPPAPAHPEARPRTKKGLGGFHAGKLTSDLDDLGIGAVTVNVVITSFMREADGAGRTPFLHAGKQWYVDQRAVASLDRTIGEAAKRGIVVSAIILVPLGKNAPAGSYAQMVAHPDAVATAHFAMPHLDQRDGAEAYAAALAFLTDRYGRPDGKQGRIHHYILHNEVDMGWEWTNAGEQPMRAYLEMYHRSMRMAHILARRHDPHAKAFISLTHHWAKPAGKHGYPSRDLLETLLAFCRVEGDFDWGIAHHPYPQDLRNPRVWADNQPTFAFDTPKITLKNIEVLDAWVRQPHVLYRGKSIRTVHLSEQGLNSPEYTPRSLAEQAAGMAYAWHKIRDLSSIEAFQYHNWVDNRHEGGLRIGLRRFPDDPDQPHGPKPIYEVYRAIGTPDESAALVEYLGVVGVRSWDEVRHRGPIK